MNEWDQKPLLTKYLPHSSYSVALQYNKPESCVDVSEAWIHVVPPVTIIVCLLPGCDQ